MTTERIQGVRGDLIEAFRSAKTEDEKTAIREKMVATFTDTEKAKYETVQKMASTIAHIDATQKALEEKRKEVVGIIQMMGFPIGQKIEVGNYTVYLTDTVNNLDTDALAIMCDEDTAIKGVVKGVIDAKRETITLATLKLTDLKTTFKEKGWTVPTVQVQQVRCNAKPKKD